MRNLTQSLLKTLLTYDEINGHFYWLIKSGQGRKAGTLKTGGYIRIVIDGVTHYAHRLVWLYQYGHWPKQFIDHKNQDRNDNRLVNLREATPADNIRNRNTCVRAQSGFKGVVKGRGNRWCARCRCNGKNHHLGTFQTKELAHAAYVDFTRKHHKEFAQSEYP